MTGQLITSDHKTYTLPSLLRWEIVYTGSVPCDSYSVTFLYDASMAEPLHLGGGVCRRGGRRHHAAGHCG